jgi:hypothetical protein
MHLHLSIVRYRAGCKAAWREELASKYSDPRNRLAAVTLRQLAATGDEDVAPESRAALSAYTGPRLVKVVDEVAREVAFRCFPADLNDFVELVLERLAEDALPAPPDPAVQDMAVSR